jgi:hypothetical protein
MTAKQIRDLIGDEACEAGNILDLTESANADPHEGAECLPQYKLALALLAQSCGTLDGKETL